jgi:hypothetical protein
MIGASAALEVSSEISTSRRKISGASFFVSSRMVMEPPKLALMSFPALMFTLTGVRGKSMSGSALASPSALLRISSGIGNPNCIVYSSKV